MTPLTAEFFKMRIRKAFIKDAEKIANIEISSGYKWRMKKEEELKMARRILNSKNSRVYILENKKQIGYFVIRFKKRICYIDFFAIIKSEQSKGFGSTLMESIINKARKNRCKKINVSVWQKNFQAIGLYNKFGFYIIGIKREHYPNKDDKLIMEKKL